MNDLKNSDMMHEMMALKVRILDHYNDILCEYAIAVFRGIMVIEAADLPKGRGFKIDRKRQSSTKSSTKLQRKSSQITTTREKM